MMHKKDNIRNNPNVGYAVDEDYPDWTKTQGVQMLEQAEILEDTGEIKHALEIYLKKSPQVLNFPAEFSKKLQFIKVFPVEDKFIDNQLPGQFQIVKY